MTSALALFALRQRDTVTIATPASLPCYSHVRTREENVDTLFNFMLLLIFLQRLRSHTVLSKSLAWSYLGGILRFILCTLSSHNLCSSEPNPEGF